MSARITDERLKELRVIWQEVLVPTSFTSEVVGVLDELIERRAASVVASGLADEIKLAIRELGGGGSYPDLIDAVDILAFAAPGAEAAAPDAESETDDESNDARCAWAHAQHAQPEAPAVPVPPLLTDEFIEELYDARSVEAAVRAQFIGDKT